MEPLRKDQASQRSRPLNDARGLRILAFCDYFSPGMGGGAERVAYEVYTRLAKAGAEITVLTTLADSPWGELPPSMRVVPVRSLDLRRLLGVQFSVTRGAFRQAERLLRSIRPHVLHANSLEFQTSVAAARLAGRTPVPLVLTAHIAGYAALNWAWRSAGTVYEQSLGRFLISRSDRVIAVSNAVADYLRRWHEISDRIRTIPNGVDHALFFPDEFPNNRDLSHVAYVGRLIKNKGPHLLLEATRALLAEGEAFKLRILGDGPMREALARTVSEDPLLRASVQLVGHTGDVPRELRDADVLVRPSQTEGMPLAVLEAMASGVCVVASDVPGNRELIQHGETGLLFQEGDLQALISTLRRAVGETEDRLRMAKAAHEEAMGYSWDRCARETLDVFQEVTSTRGAPS